MEKAELKRNVDAVLSRVKAAAERRAERVGVLPTVTVVAATKTQSPELINDIIDCGITAVGENRVQELTAKYDGVKGADWHFIGTLQSNKAKYLVGKVSLIQSVSSGKTAVEIQRLCEKRGIIQDVLAEVNVGEEPSKTGILPQNLDALIGGMEKLESLRLRGLMAVMPREAEARLYDKLYELYRRYASVTFNVLSVGMSGDYETAIEHGSNMVRIGTGFFGERKTLRSM